MICEKGASGARALKSLKFCFTNALKFIPAALAPEASEASEDDDVADGSDVRFRPWGAGGGARRSLASDAPRLTTPSWIASDETAESLERSSSARVSTAAEEGPAGG